MKNSKQKMQKIKNKIKNEIQKTKTKNEKLRTKKGLLANNFRHLIMDNIKLDWIPTKINLKKCLLLLTMPISSFEKAVLLEKL